MNGLEEIRRTFSKGAIMMDDHRIIVAYNDIGLTVYQELVDVGAMDTFRWLVNECNVLSFNVKTGSIVTITFWMDTGLSDAVIYQPLEKQIDLLKIAEELDKTERPGDDFIEFMATEGAGRKIDAGFLRDLVLFTQRKHPTFETVGGIKKWKRFYDECTMFVALCRASDVDVMKYSSDFDGCIMLTYYNEDCPVKYKASDKDAFAQALKNTSQVSFKLDVEEGYLEMDLFA